MDVDEDKEDGNQQGHPARDDLGVHQKAETIPTMMIELMTQPEHKLQRRSCPYGNKVNIGITGSLDLYNLPLSPIIANSNYGNQFEVVIRQIENNLTKNENFWGFP